MLDASVQPLILKLLDEKKAEKISYTHNPVADTMELVRRFGEVRDTHIAEAMEYLQGIRSYTDPRASCGAGEETYPGVWRVVSHTDGKLREDREDKQGIFQTLRLGFATEPLWDEARVIACESLPTNTSTVTGVSNTTSATPVESYKSIEFSSIDPLAVTDVVATLAAQTVYTDPEVEGIVLTGTWNVLATTDKQEQDGSHTIILTLAQPQFTINAYGFFGTTRVDAQNYLWNVPKPFVQTIVDAWKTAHPVGASARVSYSTNQKTADIVLSNRVFLTEATATNVVTEAGCQVLEYTDYYFGVDEATAEATVIVPADVPQGWTYSRRLSDGNDGSFDVVIVRRQSKYATMDEFIAERSRAEKVERVIQKNVTDDGGELVPIPDSNPTQGVILKQNISLNPDCSKDVVTDTITSIDQTATSGALTSDARIDNSAATITIERHSAAAAALTNAIAIVSPVGTAVEVKNIVNPDGTFQTEKKTEVAKNQTASSASTSDRYLARADQVQDTVRNTASTVELDPPFTTPGTLIEVKNTPRPDGLFETEKTTTVAVNQTATGGGASDAYQDRADKTVDVERNTATTKLADVAYATPGTLVKVENTPRPDGLFQTEKTTEVAKDQTASAGSASDRYVARADQIQDTVRHTASTVVNDVPFSTPGTIVEVKNAPRPDGLFETEVTTTIAANQTATGGGASDGYQDRADKTIDVERNTATTKLADVAYATPGTLVKVENTPRPDGLFQTEKVTEIAKDQTATATTVSSDLKENRADRSITVERHLASTIVPNTVAARTAGRVVRVENTPRPDGLYQTEQKTEVATKLEKEVTWTDADGAKKDYAGLHLTATEVGVKIAAITPTAKVGINCQPDTEFPDRFNLSISEAPDRGGNGTSNADYDAIGQFIEAWTDKETGAEMCRVTLYTRNRTNAQNFVNGDPGATLAPYGTLTAVDAVVIAGIKSAWSGSRVTASNLYRNRGTGRYVAMREQMET